MKLKFQRKILIGSVCVIFLVSLAATAGAITLTYQDTGDYLTFASVANPIIYTLTFNENEDPIAFTKATFTVETTIAAIAPEEWRIGWIAFKFSPKGGDIDKLIAPTGLNWKEGKDKEKLPWNGGSDIQPFKNSWAGIFAKDIDADGLLLTGGLASWTFGFDFTLDKKDAGKVFADDMGFKVGIYSNPTLQISENLTIPEPTTMLLLGSALIGLGLLGRKRFKSRS